ncbi:MAG: hypothetical protein ACO1RX_00245 [Candidatus Sericytochromatia bacterium]
MPNVGPAQPAFAPQTAPGNRPVSPFDRPAGAAPGSSAYQQDQVQTSQPAARGIQPNINLLGGSQSAVSPFHRPDGKPVDFLQPPAQPSAPGAAPGAQPTAKGPIVFTFPKDIPEGPAMANIQEIVLQEVQPVQQPQQALQLMAAHTQNAREARETANRFTWGARYYAVQAAEIAEQTLSQWGQMDPGQRQVFMAKVQEYRDQSISMLNEAKKHGITTYNEALKANLIYNHFFTSTGTMTRALDDPTLQVVKAEIDDTWTRWNGSFQKEWQGQTVAAKGIMTVLDETSNEVAQHLHRMNSVVSQLN